MKRSLFSSLVLVLLLVFAGCKEPAPETDGTLTLTVVPQVAGSDFAMNTSYADPAGRNYKVELLKFYLSNIKFIRDDNTEVDFQDVALLDADDPASLTYTMELEAGGFKGIKFGLGLDAEVNASDPVTFDPEHPLSSLQNTYWSWNSKYRFVMYEGRTDTTGTGTNFDNTFVVHTGLDTLYREVTLDTRPFSLEAGGATTFTMVLDVEKIFSGDYAMIDYVADWITHTSDNYNLALQVTENMAGAFE